MVRVVEYNGQHRVTIPKELAEMKGWKAGTKLLFLMDENEDIVLKEVKKGGAK